MIVSFFEILAPLFIGFCIIFFIPLAFLLKYSVKQIKFCFTHIGYDGRKDISMVVRKNFVLVKSYLDMLDSLSAAYGIDRSSLISLIVSEYTKSDFTEIRFCHYATTLSGRYGYRYNVKKRICVSVPQFVYDKIVEFSSISGQSHNLVLFAIISDWLDRKFEYLINSEHISLRTLLENVGGDPAV